MGRQGQHIVYRLTVLLSLVNAFIADAAPLSRSPAFMASTSARSTPADGVDNEWTPLVQLLDANPAELCRSSTDAASPRIAKDEGFATEVQKIWREEIGRRPPVASENKVRAVGKPITYRTSEGKPLFGYVVKPENGADHKLPGILLFHTGAGPQDIFLRWKAESLVTNPDIGGCVVLICDIISDDIGFAWSSDRTRYNNARKELMNSSICENGRIYRPELQRRVQAALDALVSLDGVDSNRLASLGWCMGGHPCLEIGRMNVSGMKAAVTFHGVFDSVEADTNNETEGDAENSSDRPRPRCLLCHGKDDPFVTADDLDNCKQIFERNGWDWTLIEFEKTRHGFTNPAQDLNPSEAFAFNEESAAAAWKTACDLLVETLS